jgi:DNA-binding transcriptional ArsR family regulator
VAEPRRSESPAELFRLSPGSRSLKLLQGHDCVVALKALAEETRVRIVGLLIDEPMDVGEIARRLPASPYNVSKHLRILREAGLLEVRKQGRKHQYALRDGIHERATEARVLDLGCCSFQFSEGGESDTPRGVARLARRQTNRTPRLAK